VYGARIAEIVDADGSGIGAAVEMRFALDSWNPVKPAPIGTENTDVIADLDSTNALATRYMRGDIVDQLLGRMDKDGSTAIPIWVLNRPEPRPRPPTIPTPRRSRRRPCSTSTT
jgi:hypothetical protein